MMTILQSLAFGTIVSLLISFLMHTQETTNWYVLTIVDFTLAEHKFAWSWPVFAIASAAAWLLQKAVQP